MLITDDSTGYQENNRGFAIRTLDYTLPQNTNISLERPFTKVLVLKSSRSADLFYPLSQFRFSQQLFLPGRITICDNVAPFLAPTKTFCLAILNLILYALKAFQIQISLSIVISNDLLEI